MRFSVRKKVFTVFAVLVVLVTIESLLVLRVVGDFHSFRAELKAINNYQHQTAALEHFRAVNANIGIGRRRNEFEKAVAAVAATLQEVEGIVAQFGPSMRAEVNESKKHLQFYRTAFQELFVRQQRDQLLHAEIKQHLVDLVRLLPKLPASQRDRISELVWPILQHEEIVFHQRDVEGFGELKKTAALLAAVTQDRDFLQLLGQIVENSEASYLNWLAIKEREDFLDDTESHFVRFAEETIATVTAEYHGRQNRMISAVFTMLALVIGYAVVCWLVSTRYLRRFLSDQQQAITAIRAGRYDYPVGRIESDELGDLTMFMKDMAMSLKNSVEQLAGSEEKYRTLVDTTATGYVIMDRQGKVQDANALYVGMTGHLFLADIKGRRVAEWTAPYDRDRSDYEIDKCMHFGYARNLVIDYVGQGGEVTPIEINATVIGAEDGPLIVALCRDISERRRAEELVAAEKERLAVTLRSIGDGVITTDTEGRVVMVNRVAEEMTGWHNDKAMGRPVAEVFNIICEKTGEPCESPVAKVLETGSIVSLANHTALIAKDGTLRSIADSGAPIRDRKSRIIGVVLVFRDVTEKQRTELELLKVKKLESVGVLAGGIAHDFNNILMAIMGNLSLAAALITPDNEAYPLLKETEKASLRACDLTQQLLTFAKGGAPIKEKADIAEIIYESVSFSMHGSNVSCQFDLPDDLWPLDIDKGQISQVLQNLVINACHAMPNGGTVRISGRNVADLSGEPFPATRDVKYVKVTVADTGVGISPAIIDRVYDPFFSTKKEGSGLGLAITHAIVTKHGGYIRVDSKPDEGAAFTIYLPASEGEGPADAKELPQSDLETVTRKCRILVMDDEEQVRQTIEAMLSHLGHEVALAADGEEAIALYHQAEATGAPFDITIMDLTIPGGMGGQQAVRLIREINPAARVLVSSGYSNDPIIADYAGHGFCGAIVKPYRFEELSEAIRQALL